jgi:hypothetical protein
MPSITALKGLLHRAHLTGLGLFSPRPYRQDGAKLLRADAGCLRLQVRPRPNLMLAVWLSRCRWIQVTFSLSTLVLASSRTALCCQRNRLPSMVSIRPGVSADGTLHICVNIVYHEHQKLERQADARDLLVTLIHRRRELPQPIPVQFSNHLQAWRCGDACMSARHTCMMTVSDAK